MKTRVPFDEDYVRLVGTAVYLFAYYEWAIIYIVDRLEPGFVNEYCRNKPMMSGQVRQRLKKAVASYRGNQGVTKADIECCSDEFANLIQKRNALIHAHPITDVDGAQILNYQSMPTRPIADMKWDAVDIENFVEEVDSAACRANELLHSIVP